MEIKKQNNFEGLIDNVYKTHHLLQQNAQKAVNLNLTIRNWLIGCYIVEFEQNGEDRAKYGTRLLEEIAKNVKVKGIKGLSLRTLRDCRSFYITYPQIRQSLPAEFKNSLYIPIRESMTSELLKEYQLPTNVLLSQLSFTHFVELLRKDDSLERLFYEVEAIKNNWSVRELKRASGIDNQLFVSKYLVNLPEKKVLEEFIQRELDYKN